MRVMVVHNRYRSSQPSGENRVVDQESELLRSGGVDVQRVERSSDEIASMPTLQKALIPARIVWSERERRMIRGSIRRTRPDVVHVHNTFPLLSPAVLAGCTDEHVPVVMTLHNFRLVCANGALFRDGRPCERCVDREPWAAVRFGCYRGSRTMTLPVAAMIGLHRSIDTWGRCVSRFIVMSEFGRDMMTRAGLPPDRLVVKPNFVPDAGVRRAGPGEYLLYLGRLAPEKGLDLLAQAWTRVRAGTRLLIAGDGPERKRVEAWARYTPGVECLGRRTTDECARLLERARALIVPSRWYETFALVVVEAFAAGVPPIGPAHGPFPELIDDEVNGLLFEPGSVSGLAAAIDRLVLDDGLSLAAGSAARTTYEDRYTPEGNLGALLAVYRDAAAHARSAA